MVRTTAWMKWLGLPLGLAVATAVVLRATTTSLPGGTSISGSITSPSEGATLPQGPVTVTGTASVATGTPVANTTLIYVVDVSGSTFEPTGHAGKCPAQNVYDTSADTTLDCELLAVHDLNQAAIATGTVAKIGMIAFAGLPGDTPTSIISAAALDLSPNPGLTTLTAPDSNEFTAPAGTTTTYPPQTNLDWVLQSAYIATGGAVPPLANWPPKGSFDGFTRFGAHDVGQQTNYTAALIALKNLLANVTTPNTLVVFLSDGLPNVSVTGSSFGAALAQLPTSHFSVATFAIGGSASCGTPAITLNGSLEAISARYGGHCELLPDPSDAVDVIPGVVASQLTSIALSMDGGAAAPPGSVDQTLPHNGPVTANFQSTFAGLVAGSHEVCATASGSDGGGPGSTPPDCVHFTIKAAPTVAVGDGSGNAGATAEGSTVHLTATASADPLQWTAVGGTGHCVFTNPSSATTDVACDDNGVYTLTLTANDGVNPAVSSSELLTVTNVPPSVAAAPQPGPINLGQLVTLAYPFTDPGANDTFVCTINWGDSSSSAGAIVGGTCRGSHAYAAGGAYTAIATVTDDDGGSGSASVTIHVDRPPVCTAVAASAGALWPPNNKFVTITLGGGSDPDGDALTSSITGVTQDEPVSAGGDAQIVSGNAVQLRAQRDGAGDGRVYRISYRLTDPLGASCSGVVTVGVPHDQRSGAAVDSGTSFNSLGTP